MKSLGVLKGIFINFFKKVFGGNMLKKIPIFIFVFSSQYIKFPESTGL